MARVHIVDGEKGGVGKSWVALTLTQYFIKQAIPFYLVETDRSNPTTTNRYKGKERYKEFCKQSVRYAVFSESEKKADSADDIFDWAIERPMIIDLPAQVHRAFSAWIDNKNVFEHSETYGVDFVKWFVCDGEDDSISLFIKSVKRYQDKMPHILVRNQGRCDEWEYFDSHPELQQTIKQYGVKVIDFPKLSDYKRILMNANRWTFEEIEEALQPKKLAQQDVVTYLKKSFAAFTSTGVLK